MAPLTTRWTRAAWLAAALAAAGCTLVDPMRQSGLEIEMSPRDTALYVGGHFTAHALMVNHYGDRYPSTHFTYSGADEAISVGDNGYTTGLALGRARIIARRGGLVDTGWVSVVPPGTLALARAGRDPALIEVAGVDGSGFLSVAEAGQFGGGAPAWLPGNGGIVYQYAIPGGAGATQLFVADLAGHSRLLVASGRSPRASRDGAWVYFANGNQILRVHPDGTGVQQINTPASAFDSFGSPDPSPDGTRIVYWHQGLIVVHTLATGVTETLAANGLLPRWAPDGLRLAYFTADDHAIIVISADGTGPHQVSAVNRRYAPNGLDWSPDGEWLVARADSSVEVVNAANGLTLPLGFTAGGSMPAWRW